MTIHEDLWPFVYQSCSSCESCFSIPGFKSGHSDCSVVDKCFLTWACVALCCIFASQWEKFCFNISLTVPTLPISVSTRDHSAENQSVMFFNEISLLCFLTATSMRLPSINSSNSQAEKRL